MAPLLYFSYSMGNSGRLSEITDTYVVKTSDKIGNSRITMSMLSTQVKQKQQSMRRGDIESGKRGKYREAFKNENGAIDLASIMVGIIVIGLIGGVIAATVFAVIPWSQDNAAKHQLDSIVSAQSAYMGLSSDSPPALPAGHKDNSFADSASLASSNLLQSGSTYCTTVSTDGKSYEGLSQSASGKVWSVTDKKTKPTDLGIGSIAPDCSFTVGPVSEDEGSETPYVDPTPTTTILTYRCDVTTTGQMPIRQSTGTAYWFDGASTDSKTYTNVVTPENRQLLANTTYTLTFEGTYKVFSGAVSNLSTCLRSVDHWGAETGVQDASSAFKGAENLMDVPQHIPRTITTLSGAFSEAGKINDSDISKWNVSNVESMSRMFNGATVFDQPLNSWNTTKVKDMSYMFSQARAFNQPLDKWKTTSLTDSSAMFQGATAFDQPLNDWDVSKVTRMTGMFKLAKSFDYPLNGWDTSSAIYMDSVFESAESFNQDLSGWKIGSVRYRSDFAKYSPLATNTAFQPKF